MAGAGAAGNPAWGWAPPRGHLFPAPRLRRTRQEETHQRRRAGRARRPHAQDHRAPAAAAGGRALPPADAEQVFTALRERVISHGSFSSPPPGFEGLAIVAKHHPRFQMELLGLVSGIDVNALGMWVVKGWNETLTEAAARDRLQ